jgi:gas vesicle protein
MAERYESFDGGSGRGGGFVTGLFTGVFLGVGLGLLFAPKAGSTLRNELLDQASDIADQASQGYRRASDSVGQWAERGRDAYNKAGEALAGAGREAYNKASDAGREAYNKAGESVAGAQP